MQHDPTDPTEPNDQLKEFIAYLKALAAEEPNTPAWAVNEIASAFNLPLMALDPDQDERLGDLGAAYLNLFGELAESGDPSVRANLPRRAYSMTRMLRADLDAMGERDRKAG